MWPIGASWRNVYCVMRQLIHRHAGRMTGPFDLAFAIFGVQSKSKEEVLKRAKPRNQLLTKDVRSLAHGAVK